MEKLFVIIALFCVGASGYGLQIFGPEVGLALYMLICLTIGVVGLITLAIAVEIPKLTKWILLVSAKVSLRLLISAVGRASDINTRRLKFTERVQMQYGVINLLMRKNSKLSMQIETLKAEVGELNKELLALVTNWGPQEAHVKIKPVISESIHKLRFVEDSASDRPEAPVSESVEY